MSLAPSPLDLDAVRRLDAADPLAGFRSRFRLPRGVVYLDGNSLGAQPVSVPDRVGSVLDAEWGELLVRGWTEAGWLEAPLRLGDKIAALVGASAGQVVVCDSTSVNLFKLLAAALEQAGDRRVVLTEAGNFPTDLYVAGAACRLAGAELRVVPRAELAGALDSSVAVLSLTQVDFRSGYRHDLETVTAAAHAAGALALWDLSHSAGVMPIALDAAGVDLAVGCGYKFLNGGPGAPAYLYVRRSLQEALGSPIQGWLGAASPFEFGDSYRPAAGVRRFLAGTPPILAMTALEAALDLALEADLDTVRAKSVALGELMIRLVEEGPWLGLSVASPLESERRGSQVALRHPSAALVMEGLTARGVIGDFRPPDNLRFGFAPLYTRFEDVWLAVAALAELLG